MTFAVLQTIVLAPMCAQAPAQALADGHEVGVTHLLVGHGSWGDVGDSHVRLESHRFPR